MRTIDETVAETPDEQVGPAQCRCPNGPEYFYPPETGPCHYCGAE